MDIVFVDDLNKYQIYTELPKMKLALYGFVYRQIDNSYYINLILKDEKNEKILPIFLAKMENTTIFLPSILKEQKLFLLKSIFQEIYQHITLNNMNNGSIMSSEFWKLKEINEFLKNTNLHRSPFFFEVSCPGCINHPLKSIYYYNQVIDKFLCHKKDEKIKILDLGCGLGLGSLILAKNKNFEITAVDNNIYLMPIINKIVINQENVKFTTEVPKEKFDIIISLETLEHNENPELFLKYILQMLKDEGTAILSVPNWFYHGTDLNSDHLLNFTPKKFKSILERIDGIDNIEVYVDALYDLNSNPMIDFKFYNIQDLDIDKIDHIYAKFDKIKFKKINNVFVKENLKPKNLLFINHSIPPYEYTGTPISTFNQMRGLRDIGYNTAIMIPHPNIKSDFEISEFNGIKIYKIPSLNWKYNFLNDAYMQFEIRWYIKTINHVLEDFKPDIIHINDYVFMTSKMIEFFEASNIKMVKQVHNIEEICYWGDLTFGKKFGCEGPTDPYLCANCIIAKEPQQNKLFKLRKINETAGKVKARIDYMQYIYNLFDAVVFSNESWREYFNKFINTSHKKEYIVPIGFKFNSDRPNNIRKTTSPLNLIYLGTLSEGKGFEIIINLFSDSRILKSDFLFEIYGEAYNSYTIDALKNLEQLSNGKVKYMGKYNNVENLKNTIMKADIAIFPSYFETYGRVLRELIYFGVPVISSDVYGVKGFIEDGKNGFVCGKTDIECFKEKLLYLLNNPYVVDRLKEGCLKTQIPSLEDEILALDKLYFEIFNGI